VSRFDVSQAIEQAEREKRRRERSAVLLRHADWLLLDFEELNAGDEETFRPVLLARLHRLEREAFGEALGGGLLSPQDVVDHVLDEVLPKLLMLRRAERDAAAPPPEPDGADDADDLAVPSNDPCQEIVVPEGTGRR
jgi:transposase InsO family protein